MMPELWIAISTMCVWSDGLHNKFLRLGEWYPSGTVIQEPYCFQQVSISTFPPTLKEDETVYKVMPENHVAIPKKGIEWELTTENHWHRWVWDEAPHVLQRCAICGDRRHKVVEEKWVGE